MKSTLNVLLLLVFIAGLSSCDKTPDDIIKNDRGWVYSPEAYTVQMPRNLPSAAFPTARNPLTVQGIKLGRMLFYDPILSGDSTLACGGCHKQENAFSDPRVFSVGIDGLNGKRHSMPLFNLVYGSKFFWDGRAATLAEQALMPVEDPLEMHAQWATNILKLQGHTNYPKLFYEAFGVEPEDITKEHAGRALEQFMLTLVSGQSKFDKAVTGFEELTDAEQRGFALFNDANGADCFHCHGDGGGNQVFQELNPLFQFRNNGLDDIQNAADFVDKGFGSTTGKPADNGKFKVPSLRNLAFTAPYMHDGRFATLEEVVNFYSEGVHPLSANIDHAGMQFAADGGVQLTAQEKSDLIAFLRTLSDDEFITNPAFSDPFK
ncbi:cytochrome c peroxidase [soil metagenome]